MNAEKVQNDTNDDGENQKERRKRKYYVGDFNSCLENLPSIAVQCFEKSKQTIDEKSKRMKVLKQQNRLLFKKIETNGIIC